MAELWQVIRLGSWGERLKAISLFLLLVSIWASICVGAYILDGR